MSMQLFSRASPTSRDAYTVFDMSSEDLQRIEARMFPDIDRSSRTSEQINEMEWVDLSKAGFLARGEKLKDVCTRDLATLDKLGVSCDQICDVWEKFWGDSKNLAAFSCLGIEPEEFVKKGGKVEEKDLVWSKPPESKKFRVSYFPSSDGFQSCPFSKEKRGCHYGKEEVAVENLENHEWVVISDLTISMVRKHAFFQGNTPYRLDPEKFCRVFGLST